MEPPRHPPDDEQVGIFGMKARENPWFQLETGHDDGRRQRI